MTPINKIYNVTLLINLYMNTGTYFQTPRQWQLCVTLVLWIMSRSFTYYHKQLQSSVMHGVESPKVISFNTQLYPMPIQL